MLSYCIALIDSHFLKLINYFGNVENMLEILEIFIVAEVHIVEGMHKSGR